MTKVGLWLIGILLLGNHVAADADFFRAESDPAAKLSADHFYPQGKRFLFSGYAPMTVDQLKGQGFTAAGPGYKMARLTDQALAAKMPLIYFLETPYQGEILTHKRFEQFHNDKVESLDWDEIYQAVTKSVQDAMAKADSLIVCWNLTPEELRYWRPLELKYLQVASKAIRDADPRKRPVWMYLPGHYQQKALEQYTPYLDFLGQGMYPNYAKRSDQRVWCRFWGEEQQNAISQAVKAGRKVDTLVVTEMFQEPADRAMIPVWVRHDVYLALMMGSKGVVVFSLAERPNFPSHGKYQDAYAQVARELTQSPLGEVFLFGERMNELSSEVVTGPGELALYDVPGKVLMRKFAPVALTDIRHHTGRYLFLVNSADGDVTVSVKGFPDGAIDVLDAVSGEKLGAVEQGKLLLKFSKYEVKLLKLVSANKEAK